MAIEVRPGVAHLGGAIFDQAKANRERFERDAARQEEQRQFENEMQRREFELEKAISTRRLDIADRQLDMRGEQFDANIDFQRERMDFQAQQQADERAWRELQAEKQAEREFDQWKRRQDAVYTAEQERKLAEYAKAKDWVTQAYNSGQLSEEDANAAWNNIQMAENGVTPHMPQRVDEFEGISIMGPNGSMMQVQPNSVFTTPSGGEAYLDAEGNVQLLVRPDQMPSAQGPQNALEWAEQRAALREAAISMIPIKQDAEGNDIPITEDQIDAKIKEIESGYASEMGMDVSNVDAAAPPEMQQQTYANPDTYFRDGISDAVFSAARNLDGEARKKSIQNAVKYGSSMEGHAEKNYNTYTRADERDLKGAAMNQPGGGEKYVRQLSVAANQIKNIPALDIYPPEVVEEMFAAGIASNATFDQFVSGAEYLALVMRPDLGIPPQTTLSDSQIKRALMEAGYTASDVKYELEQWKRENRRK